MLLQVICLCFLVATSMAGGVKKEKRGVFGHGAPMAFDAGYGYSSYAGKIYLIEIQNFK